MAKSRAALIAGLTRAKVTFRQRNLYCQFDLDDLAAGELGQLEAKSCITRRLHSRGPPAARRR